MNDQSAATLAGPKRKPFRTKYGMVRLAPDAWDRQSRITLLAWDLLGADGATTFLNGHSVQLKGRPLDIAVASAAGYHAVEREISSRSSSE